MVGVSFCIERWESCIVNSFGCIFGPLNGHIRADKKLGAEDWIEVKGSGIGAEKSEAVVVECCLKLKDSFH